MLYLYRKDIDTFEDNHIVTTAFHTIKSFVLPAAWAWTRQYTRKVTRTVTQDWQWDDLFDVTIYYGTFNVNGTKTRTFKNPGNEAVTPKFTCSAPMIVEVNGIPGYALMTGETANPGFVLQPGDNTLVFSGTGTVMADYSMGKSL